LSVGYDEFSNQVTLYPSAVFGAGLIYTVTVKAALADLSGNLLGIDSVFNFTIGQPVNPPTVHLPVIRRH
jgi:hypothetical protein